MAGKKGTTSIFWNLLIICCASLLGLHHLAQGGSGCDEGVDIEVVLPSYVTVLSNNAGRDGTVEVQIEGTNSVTQMILVPDLTNILFGLLPCFINAQRFAARNGLECLMARNLSSQHFLGLFLSTNSSSAESGVIP